MRIVLDLSDNDLRYFRNQLKVVKDGKLASDEKVVLGAARQLVAEVAAAGAPRFVQEHMGRLQRLVEMLEDERWKLEAGERKRILNALAYFVDPDDLVPDRIPGLGYLDDAILVALVVQEFRREIDAYEKFIAQGEAATEKKSQSLLSRVRSARRSEIERRRLVKGRRGPLGLFW